MTNEVRNTIILPTVPKPEFVNIVKSDKAATSSLNSVAVLVGTFSYEQVQF